MAHILQPGPVTRKLFKFCQYVKLQIVLIGNMKNIHMTDSVIASQLLQTTGQGDNGQDVQVENNCDIT